MRTKGVILRRFLFLVLLFISYNVQANTADSLRTVIDSLLEVQKEYEDDNRTSELIGLNIEISKNYKNLSDYPSSLKYAEKALAIQNITHNYSKQVEIYFEIGYANDWLNNYQKALEYYDLSYEANEQAEIIDIKKKGIIFGRKASVYKSLGKYEKSYDNHLNSIQIAETLKDTYEMATGYYHLGSLFYYQQQYEKALEYYLTSQGLAENVKDGSKISYACLAALGTTYQGLEQYEKSLEYNLKSLKLAEELEHTSGIGYSLSNIGSIYISLEKFEKAGEYFERSLILKKELKDKWGMIGTYRSMADLASIKGIHKKAITYLEEAYSIAKEIDSKPRQIEILLGFSAAYKNNKNHELALSYMESYVALKDSVLNKTTVEKMGNLKENYELVKKENEILVHKNENDKLLITQEKDKLFQYLVTVVALFFGVLMLLFVSRYRTQKKSSVLLKGKNEEINRQNSELQKVNELISQTNNLLEQNKLKIEEQNKALESSNEDLRNFASVASHDLKEPLRMINAYTSMLKKKYSNLFDDRAHEFMGYVVDGVSRMEQLINSLLDYSRVSIDGGAEKLKLINIRDVAEVVKGNLRYPIVKNSATVNIDNAENFPIVRANHIQMMQLMQNLVSNALKFKGERLPVINIGFSTEGDYHTFYIKDNGIGISKENQEKIFDMLTRLHTKEEYEGTGIGLATVRKIVERHKGRIWVESVEGEGSTFFFTLPVVRSVEPVMAEVN